MSNNDNISYDLKKGFVKAQPLIQMKKRRTTYFEFIWTIRPSWPAIGGKRTMRGTSGREPHIPYQTPNMPYQICNCMSF